MESISQELRQSVLQAAIQGKLVEQRPEEGTAEDLYKQIQAEKQALIKAGKLKKEKPLLAIAEEEKPFDIPESWKWVRFLSVVNIATNLVQPTGYPDYKHIAPDNIEKGTGKLLPCKTVAEDNVASANHFFVEGQIIYSKIRPLLRKAVIAPFNGLCSADMYPLRTKLDSQYILHYLLSDAFNHQIADVMSNRVKMPKINQEEMSKVLLPLPPLTEQRRIVNRVKELMALIDNLEKIENELRALHQAFPGDMKAALLQAAMQGRLTKQLPEDGTAQDLYKEIQTEKLAMVAAGKLKKEKSLPEIDDDEKPFDIPDNWTWVRLNSVISLLSGSDLTPEKYNAQSNGIPYITGASNIDGPDLIINRWTTSPNNIAHEGDLLLTCKGTVGKTHILKEKDVHIARQIMAITPIMVDTLYVQYFIENQVEALKAKAKSMIPGIERENVLKLIFPLPPLAEQHRIVERLNLLLPLCDTMQSSL